MDYLRNPRIIGSFVVGFALIAGAYTLSTFGQPTTRPIIQQAAVAGERLERAPITVLDEDDNGIEDWRDEFVLAPPIIVDASESPQYTAPDTVTAQVGVGFMEGIIRAKHQGPLARRSETDVIEDSAELALRSAQHKIYDVPDIIIADTTNETIRTYSNAAADTILNHNVPGTEWELYILQDIAVHKKTERIEELKMISGVYAAMRDDMLALPVPDIAVKEHLDLINTYHALHKTIEALAKIEDDPTVALANLQRYEDDKIGLLLALQNSYEAFSEYANLFTPEDSATLFVLFSPDYQGP